MVLLSISEETVRLVQVTDSHLFETREGNLLSVSTNDSFLAVIEAIAEQGTNFDAVLATGDISQDHTEQSYQYFVDNISALKSPCFWLPGNHDEQSLMHSSLDQAPIYDHKHVLLGEHWQCILLDSQVSGVPHGGLNQDQLDFLVHSLDQHPERHALILLHHHPILVKSEWLDQHTLKNSESFWSALKGYSNVKAVLCGHVHQEMDTMHNDVRVLSTPSTCIQFKPLSDQFALDQRSPGWREIHLHKNGHIETSVKRLTDGLYQPDFSSNGY
ncbi:3',5'-cyclic-AMP phosphodiesterase [Vibrio sp.]|nr:3',5'-cyclic-AMP phosphodiesterase [Vibrio sp.]